MESVSFSSIFAMGVTLAICVGLPVLLWVVFQKKMGKGVSSAVIAGALGFFIPQAMIRVPALQGLSLLPGFAEFAQTHFWWYAIALAFSAGLFETVGRLAIFKTFLRNRTTYNSALCAGLGHGGIEAAYLIGLTYVNNLVLSFMINSGNAMNVLEGQGLSNDQATQLVAALTQTSPMTFYLAGFERIFTIGFHIGLSVLLAYGITQKKTVLYFIVVLAIHTAVDFVAVAGQYVGASIYVIEGFVMLVGILAVVLVVRAKKHFKEIQIPRDEAELAVEEGY